MSLAFWGALCFGVVVGWITYRTLRRSQTSGLSDIATVIGVIGGAAVTKLFPNDQFAAYAIGVAIGFFAYLISSAIAPEKVAFWMGESVPTVRPPKLPSTK